MFGMQFGLEITKTILELHQKLAKELQTTANLRNENSNLDAELQNTKFQLQQMRQERDDIQARLHAVDHAYCEQQRIDRQVNEDFKRLAALVDDLKVQNQKLGDSKKPIRDQQETIRKQREFIRTLYTSRHRAKGKRP